MGFDEKCMSVAGIGYTRGAVFAPVRAIVLVRPICELERFDTTATLLKYIQKHWLPLSQVLVIIQTMYKTESLRPGVRTAIDVVKERIR